MSHEVRLWESGHVAVLSASLLCCSLPQDMSSQQAVVESVASSLKQAGLFEMVLMCSDEWGEEGVW